MQKCSLFPLTKLHTQSNHIYVFTSLWHLCGMHKVLVLKSRTTAVTSFTFPATSGRAHRMRSLKCLNGHCMSLSTSYCWSHMIFADRSDCNRRQGSSPNAVDVHLRVGFRNGQPVTLYSSRIRTSVVIEPAYKCKEPQTAGALRQQAHPSMFPSSTTGVRRSAGVL